MAKTQTGPDHSTERIRTVNRTAVERIAGESVPMIREALRVETRCALERASAAMVSVGRVHDGQHLSYYVALLARLADVVSAGGAIVHRTGPAKFEEWFTSYAKPVTKAGDAKTTVQTVVGTASTIFAKELCEALADCRVDATGLSALAFVAARFTPVPVPDDVDTQGRPRPTGILPSGLLPDAPRQVFVSVQDRSDAMMVLPGRTVDSDLPLLLLDVEDPGAPLLRLADAAGVGALQRGRGARMDKRLLFFSLLSMPRADRHPGGRYDHTRPLRWWVERLYPNRYRPSEAEGQIRAGMRALVDATVRLPSGGEWIPVVPRQYPDFRNLDSPLRLEISLPEDCDHGAALPWRSLIAAGVKSDPAFDLVVGLAYLWDRAKARAGGYRIYSTRPKARRTADGYLLDVEGNIITARAAKPFRKQQGGLVWPAGNVPVSDWRHSRAVIEGVERHPRADLVPPLTREGRRRLVFVSTNTPADALRRKQRQRADAAITAYEKEGGVVVERLPGGSWRLLEPVPGTETKF